MATFDVADVFDDDYLHFYADILDDARSDAETALIRRLLRIGPGDRVLDVPCGHGRLANRLAAAGAEVTGVDITPPFLELARDDAAGRGLSVTYLDGDVRDLPVLGPFDAVVNWFTSFGYHDDDTERAVLAGLRRVLRPGGRLGLELMNRDRVVRGRVPGQPPPTFTVEVGDDLLVDEVDLDPVGARAVTRRTMVRDGRVRRTTFDVRLFTEPELRSWLADAGFATVETFGTRGEAFTWASDRLIAVATA